jgi:hypothetical protein
MALINAVDEMLRRIRVKFYLKHIFDNKPTRFQSQSGFTKPYALKSLAGG